MATQAGFAERIAYGRPVDPAVEDTQIRVVERSGTVLIGRVLLASIFMLSGIAKLANTEQTVGYMTSAGIPQAEFLVYVAAFAEILGALAVITGFLARLGALGLILFLIPTTFMFHSFWTFEGEERVMQMSNFMKNLGLIGGLALLFAYGPGRYSIDHKMRQPMQP
jgi:putative oxidoreductase